MKKTLSWLAMALGLSVLPVQSAILMSPVKSPDLEYQDSLLSGSYNSAITHPDKLLVFP